MGKWFSKEVKNVNSETLIVAAGNKSDSVVDHDAVQYGIFSLMLCVLISVAVYTYHQNLNTYNENLFQGNPWQALDLAKWLALL